MARNDSAAEGEVIKEPKKGGKLKLIIIIAVVVIVLAAGGAAAKILLFNKKPASQAAAPKPVKMETLKLESIVVNLADQDANHYLRITVVLAFPGDEKTAEEIAEKEFELRDRIIQLLRTKHYAEVSTPDCTEKLKEEIIREINRHLDKHEITDVYLSEFLVQ
ncbi:MAG: flagellar basal body-associated FliL family protein [Bacillota bacterium]